MDPGTPRSNFVTPRRLGTASRTPGLSDRAQNTTRNQFATPRGNYATPKSRKLEPSSDTPECFSTVTLETPVSATKRSSKDKCDEVSNLTVAVRIRPMNTKELACVGSCDVVRVRDTELIIRTHPNAGTVMSMDHIFQYDHIFWSCDESNPMHATQEDVFMTVAKPLLYNAFRGYNACLFAYGQTGSGKSFSMMGRNVCDVVDIDSDEYSGITPRFCRDLFERIAALDKTCISTVEVSYFEIYNEKIHDLLASGVTANRTPLKVREHPEWGPYVVDLSMHTVKTYKELRNWLLLGNKNRATAATSMNEKSSRSHSIFSIELCLSESVNGDDLSRRSKVSLVDLAGSERLSNLHSSEKMREGVYINKSLLTLGKVISALADQKKQFVPYRDSVLTWLLRESLGGNSLTCMLATISPANSHLEETLATLRYACQARSIVNRARVNESPHDRLIRELRLEVERLKSLRINYQSLTSSSSSLTINDTSTEELDELRNKLVETENRLREAESNWEKRFMESWESQKKELEEAELYKAELESKVRVMSQANKEIKVSPYKSNFLEELEKIFTDGDSDVYENDKLDVIKNWCHENGLICTVTADTLVIIDQLSRKQAVVTFSNLSNVRNVGEFMRSLQWTRLVKPAKKLSKREVMASMDQIYQALSNLQPAESDNSLNLLYAKVNKSLLAFEAALLNTVKSNSSQKTVSFNM